MKLDQAVLNRFKCDKCQCWWHITSAEFFEFSVGNKLCCPWCGVENEITEIDQGKADANDFAAQPQNNNVLKQRILKRWKDWWAHKHNPPVDRLLMELIAMALDEVQSSGAIAITQDAKSIVSDDRNIGGEG